MKCSSPTRTSAACSSGSCASCSRPHPGGMAAAAAGSAGSRRARRSDTAPPTGRTSGCLGVVGQLPRRDPIEIGVLAAVGDDLVDPADGPAGTGPEEAGGGLVLVAPSRVAVLLAETQRGPPDHLEGEDRGEDQRVG